MLVTSHSHATPQRETYTLHEFATKLGLSRTVAYELARTDALPVKAIRLGRRYLYPKTRVDALLAGEAEHPAS